MNEAQIERVRDIVQEIATDESISFDEAFAIAMGHLKYWINEMPKGGTFSGGDKSQIDVSHSGQVSD